MNILYNKNFLKDLSVLPGSERTRIEKFAFNDTLNFRSIRDVAKAEKLQGYTNYYKLRFGNYRIGIHYFDGTLTFERVLHRKEIYRYFP